MEVIDVVRWLLVLWREWKSCCFVSLVLEAHLCVVVSDVWHCRLLHLLGHFHIWHVHRRIRVDYFVVSWCLNSIYVDRLWQRNINRRTYNFDRWLKSFPSAVSEQLRLRLLCRCVIDVSLFCDHAEFEHNFTLLWVFEIYVLGHLESISSLQLGLTSRSSCGIP